MVPVKQVMRLMHESWQSFVCSVYTKKNPTSGQFHKFMLNLEVWTNPWQTLI